jgi:hypothetical protein
LPKRCFLAIPKSDGSGGIEDVHIFVVARVTVANPNLVGVFPLEPRPPETESRSKLGGMKDAKTTQLLGVTHQIPIDLALGTGSSVFGGPKESSLDLVDEFDSLRRHQERGEMVDGLGGDEGFDQGGAAGRGNKFAISRRELANALILKKLKVHPPQGMNRKRQPKIPQRKRCSRRWHPLKDIIKVDANTSNGNN